MVRDRFDRNVRFFGAEGQRRLRASRCAVVGVGGLGTHVVQQLALLGVGRLDLIDAEELDETNLNRYVGVRRDDPIPGTRKIDIGKRLAASVDPEIRVETVCDSFVSEAGFAAIRAADFVFGCLDSVGARLVLTELCAAYARPYIDLASDVFTEERLRYGGCVCFALGGQGCLSCFDQLDREEAGQDLETEAARRDRAAIYGVDRGLLHRAGPSVVSLNGVIASLGVTEFMVGVTGLRQPRRLLTYDGSTGKVTVGSDPVVPDCWYCKVLYGRGAEADVERHVRSGLGTRLR